MNPILRLAFTLLIPAAVHSVAAAGTGDYSDGILWINEDWYGHQNSTVNYLRPDDPEGNYWEYRVIQTENPGMELGCTNQFGALWNGKLYLIAKQAKDPGASITGGRITIADGKSLKILAQLELIDPSGAQCDGRGFLGVDSHKAYISSSNGVWVFDTDTYTVLGRIEGTSNPNAGEDNDRPNTDPTGSLYHGQCGMMVAAAGRVFVAHQQYGLLVVDPRLDAVVDRISMDVVQEGAGIGSVVKSKDGTLWISIAKNTQGTGATLPYVLKLDPSTLEHRVISIPDNMFPPSNSWYAWTPDAFVASSLRNCLYWKGGPNRWFTGTKIYRFDCDTEELSLFIDLEDEGAGWRLYGCALGVHPRTDELYMALYHEFGTPTYITRRYSPQGVKIRDYEMIINYWFPSLPVFNSAPGQTVLEFPHAESSGLGDLYTAGGVLIRRLVAPDDSDALGGLPPGLYIWTSPQSIRKIALTR